MKMLNLTSRTTKEMQMGTEDKNLKSRAKAYF